MPIIKKAVVLVAGLGTRLLPATKSQPKEMLPVGRKPAVQYIVEELLSAGMHEILFITGRTKRSIEDHFDYDERLFRRLVARGSTELMEAVGIHDADVGFFYARQPVPRGTADAVLRARAFAGGEPFVVALGDSIIKERSPAALLGRMIESHLRQEAEGTIAVERVHPDDIGSYGIVRPKDAATEDFEIADLVEKPEPASAPSDLAIAGRYIFDPCIFEFIEQTEAATDDEYQLPDAIRLMIQQGRMVRAVRLSEDEHRYDVGDFGRYFKTFIDFCFDDEEHGEAMMRHAWQRIQDSNLISGGKKP